MLTTRTDGSSGRLTTMLMSAMSKLYAYLKKTVRKYSSPVFLLLVILSTVLWYVTKLSHTYTATIPVAVAIGDNRFKVDCVVEGTGYRLFAHKYFFNKELKLDLNRLEVTPSVAGKNLYVISPYSLQNQISKQKEDVRILSVGMLPEITLMK